MDQQAPQLFWTNMVRQRSEREAAAPARMAAPPCSHQADSLLDGEKTRAMLLFSGVALVVVGVTFTFMGWRYQQTNPAFEWLKLLGPILISVGVTFVLTSVCKCTNFSWFCRRGDDDVLVMSVTEQTSRARCCAISGRTQPIMIHDVTAILCAPPEYSFSPEAQQGLDLQPRSPVCGVCAAPPPTHGAVHCLDNVRGNRSENPVPERGRDDKNGPPAYEDLYPSFSSVTNVSCSTSGRLHRP